tara:strand:- start:88 stop:933 length:846 start_codon:yes stop_codon:yes gene_type:complete
LKKVLIIGASGFLGNYCFNKFLEENQFDVEGTRNSSLNKKLTRIDYTNSLAFSDFITKSRPDFIVWCAGLKKLSLTEKDLELARKQNFYPIKTIVDYQNYLKDVSLVFISTDYVFNGLKGNYKSIDAVNPSTNYGKSKVSAENYIIEKSPNFSILRAGGIIGKESVFLNWLVDKIKLSETIELYDNIFTPTPIKSVFKAIKILMNSSKNGIYHVTGKQKLSRYEFGNLVKKHFKSSSSELIEVKCDNNNFNFLKDLSLINSKEFFKFESIEKYISNALKHD